MKALTAGDLIGERYKVIRPLRGSGLGGIYLASHTSFPDRIVAMKVLHVSEIENIEETEARCRNEVVAAYNINHPNVVETYDYIREGDIMVVIMEYVPGGDVADLLAKKGTLQIGQILDILVQLLSGLQAIHTAGIIHRDLKPENLMFTEDGCIKISDFGTARMGKETISKGDGITGTLAYLSPEYLKNGSLDERSDIYSIGVLIYELTTGKTPFAGSSAMELLTKKLTAMPAPPIELNPNCSPELSEIATRALSHNPEERFATAKEMMDALRKVSIPDPGQVQTPAQNPAPNLVQKNIEDTFDAAYPETSGSQLGIASTYVPEPLISAEPSPIETAAGLHSIDTLNELIDPTQGSSVSQVVDTGDTLYAANINPMTELFGSPDIPPETTPVSSPPPLDAKAMLEQIESPNLGSPPQLSPDPFAIPELESAGFSRPKPPSPNNLAPDYLDDYPTTLNLPQRKGPKPILVAAVFLVVAAVVITPLISSGDGEASTSLGSSGGSPATQTKELKDVTNIRLRQISRALKKSKAKNAVINTITDLGTSGQDQPRALSPTSKVKSFSSTEANIKPRWYVLFGKTDDLANAEIVSKRLVDAGFLAKIRQRSRGASQTHEVIVGPYDDKASAILNMKLVERSGIGGTSLKIMRIRE